MKSLPEKVRRWDFREALQTLLDKYTPAEEKIDISKLSDNWVRRLYDIVCTKDEVLREQKWVEWKEEGEKAEKQLICDSYEVLSVEEQLENIEKIRKSIKEFGSELKTPSLKDLESEINLSFDK